MNKRGEMLERMSDGIRAYYISKRRKFEEARTGRASKYTPGNWWDGGKVPRSGVVRGNFWLRAAKQLCSRSIDYQPFIDFVFERHQVEHIADRNMYCPYPNTLTSKQAQDDFLCAERSDAALERRRGVFKSQQQVAHSAIMRYEQYGLYGGKTKVLQAVLTDSSLSLSALFRFCVAHHEGLQDVKEFYREQALLQYGRSVRGYDQVWKEWIPGDLREDAAAVFQGSGGQNGERSSTVAN